MQWAVLFKGYGFRKHCLVQISESGRRERVEAQVRLTIMHCAIAHL
jgi:hypothetical protein